MPKPPVTISIVPSKLALAVQGGLALAASALLAWVAAPWLAATALLCLGGVIGHWWWRQSRWSLRHASGEGGWQVSSDGYDWRDVRLSVVYLGPWLIGLKIDAQPLWLWPDSADSEARRDLRRRLRVAQNSGQWSG